MSRIGTFLRSAFGGSKPEAEALRRVKAWAVATLGASPDTAFAVNEIACTDPSCPGIETVILVMEPGRKTQAVKIGKPIEEVTEDDIRAAAARATA
jgi:hypothetical protein